MSFLLTSLRKNYFFTSETLTLPILMAKIVVLLVLDTWLPASSRILMRNRFMPEITILRFHRVMKNISLV